MQALANVFYLFFWILQQLFPNKQSESKDVSEFLFKFMYWRFGLTLIMQVSNQVSESKITFWILQNFLLWQAAQKYS